MNQDHIFVFGSNLAGRHGAGAAYAAKQKFGAVYGVGEGPTGRAYAIPTLDGHLNQLQLPRISIAVKDFREYAAEHPEMTFFVTRIGCGLAGFGDHEIGPMFNGVPGNCILPMEWQPYLNDATLNTAQFHNWESEQIARGKP